MVSKYMEDMLDNYLERSDEYYSVFLHRINKSISDDDIVTSLRILETPWVDLAWVSFSWILDVWIRCKHWSSWPMAEPAIGISWDDSRRLGDTRYHDLCGGKIKQVCQQSWMRLLPLKPEFLSTRLSWGMSLTPWKKLCRMNCEERGSLCILTLSNIEARRTPQSHAPTFHRGSSLRMLHHQSFHHRLTSYELRYFEHVLFVDEANRLSILRLSHYASWSCHGSTATDQPIWVGDKRTVF